LLGFRVELYAIRGIRSYKMVLDETTLIIAGFSTSACTSKSLHPIRNYCLETIYSTNQETILRKYDITKKVRDWTVIAKSLALGCHASQFLSKLANFKQDIIIKMHDKINLSIICCEFQFSEISSKFWGLNNLARTGFGVSLPGQTFEISVSFMFSLAVV